MAAAIGLAAIVPQETVGSILVRFLRPGPMLLRTNLVIERGDAGTADTLAITVVGAGAIGKRPFVAEFRRRWRANFEIQHCLGGNLVS